MDSVSGPMNCRGSRVHVVFTNYADGTISSPKKCTHRCECVSLEGPMGLEPMTPCLKGRCSNQLSYGPATLCSIQQRGWTVNRSYAAKACIYFFLPSFSTDFTGFVKNKSPTASSTPMLIIRSLFSFSQPYTSAPIPSSGRT